jgi:hypothetical protein
MVVDGINTCPELDINFPTSHEEQRKLASEFQSKSGVSFGNCVLAIDGILIWTHKPSPTDCIEAGVGAKKFLCSRKHKFGLNMQACCDANGRFLDVSICHPGATSDHLAFATSWLHNELEQEGFLAPGLAIYGDNAYVNCGYMVSPFPNIGSGPKDDFNYFHSQLRISIECAFGMLVHRWAILRKPMPMGISLSKVTALSVALCKLHNFCIDHEGGLMRGKRASPVLLNDEFSTQVSGAVALGIDGEGHVRASDLVGLCDHRDDHGQAQRLVPPSGHGPRDVCMDVVQEKGLHRPPPADWVNQKSLAAMRARDSADGVIPV